MSLGTHTWCPFTVACDKKNIMMRWGSDLSDFVRYSVSTGFKVLEDFREFFASRTRGRAPGRGDGQGGHDATAVAVGAVAEEVVLVTLEGFMEYYRDVGVCEPYDTVFVPTMEVRGEEGERRERGGERGRGWGLYLLG